MNILEKTLKEMPTTFTSHYFNKKAIKNGYPKNMMENKGLAWFLHKHADNDIYRNRTWTLRKNDIIEKKEEQVKIFEPNNIFDAIILLKSNGYKVMKPVAPVKEWEEI